MKWGILGASKFAGSYMGPALHAASGSQLAALATSDPVKAAPFRAINPDVTVYDDYDALLADPNIEAVHIPLPNHLHVPWALKALEAGKHVLCEKPFAMQAHEFDQLERAARAADRHCAEAFMIVHHPQWHRVRDLLAAGTIGRLRHIDGCFTYNNAEDTGNIRNDPAKGGGGLRDIGVYPFGAARFATGKDPISVPYAKLEFENGVDVFANVSAVFEGFTMNAVVSMRMQTRQSMVFQGDNGHITVKCPFNPLGFDQAEVTVENARFQTQTERWPEVNQYVLQVENFTQVAAGQASNPCPLAFSRGTQEMIEMVFAAGQQT